MRYIKYVYKDIILRVFYT